MADALRPAAGGAAPGRRRQVASLLRSLLRTRPLLLQDRNNPRLQADGSDAAARYIAQSGACSRAVATLCGLFPSNMAEAAYQDSLFEAGQELATINPIVNVFTGEVGLRLGLRPGLRLGLRLALPDWPELSASLASRPAPPVG